MTPDAAFAALRRIAETHAALLAAQSMTGINNAASARNRAIEDACRAIRDHDGGER